VKSLAAQNVLNIFKMFEQFGFFLGGELECLEEFWGVKQ
jgi:hypothetical protein